MGLLIFSSSVLAGQEVCEVRSSEDTDQRRDSIRLAVKSYNQDVIKLCRDRIVLYTNVTLKEPIVINQNPRDPDGVIITGNTRDRKIIDASAINSGCAIDIRSNNKITLRHLRITGSKGDGICGNRDNLVLENVESDNHAGAGLKLSGSFATINNSSFRSNNIGIQILNGSNNTITNSRFASNRSFGLSIDTSETQNCPAAIITEDDSKIEGDENTSSFIANRYVGNREIAISSVNTELRPLIKSITPDSSTSQTNDFIVIVEVPNAVSALEIYRNTPRTNDAQTFIARTEEFPINLGNSKQVQLTIEAERAESIFAVAYSEDCRTSPVDLVNIAEVIGAGGTTNGSGNGQFNCTDVNPEERRIIAASDVPELSQGLRGTENSISWSQTIDHDCDGILTMAEDKNRNGEWDAETETNFLDNDTDNDGLFDGVEDSNKNGIVDDIPENTNIGETDPKDFDTDGDGILDGDEDQDKDGIWDRNSESNPRDDDTDNDGLLDNEEDINLNGIHEPELRETKTFQFDSDRDGISDKDEVRIPGIFDPAIDCDPNDDDSDNDGLKDGNDPCCQEDDLDCQFACIPLRLQREGILPENQDNNADSDNDGIPDIVEDRDRDCQKDADETDPYERDTDEDGIPDGNDSCPLDPDNEGNCCVPGIGYPDNSDPDGDRLPSSQEDLNDDCQVNPGESDPNDRDSDNDGCDDYIEKVLGTDPLRADTDGDGLPDCGAEDRNGDGILDNLDTDPTKPDTDGDGFPDGQDICPLSEENNKSCVIYNPGQVDPYAILKDSDRDGLNNSIETNGTGIYTLDPPSGQTDPFDDDSDNDGLKDGIEVNRANTDPRNPDTDGDKIPDGIEDYNKNGIVDPSECDPTTRDTDRDGIEDNFEDRNLNGIFDSETETNCNDSDTDDDGVSDGDEDKNGNGLLDFNETNPRSNDTDGDGFDDNQDNDPFSSNKNSEGCSLNPHAEKSPIFLIVLLSSLLFVFTLRKKKQASNNCV